MLEYVQGDSFLHRLNPVTKLVVATCLVVATFLMPGFAPSLVVALLLLACAWLAGVAGRAIRPTLSILAPLAIALLLIQGMFYPGRQTPVVTVGPITFWREGLLYALTFTCRIAVIILAFLLLMLTTHPKALSVALVQRGMSPKLAYVFLASLQFIPEMQRRALIISEAQQARGLDTRANLWRRLGSLTVMLVPLIAGALIAAETRFLALEARGFGRKGQRTSLLEVPDGGMDRLLRWAAPALLLLLIAWKVVS